MALSYDEISEILKLIDGSSCDEFVLETDDIKLVVRRRGAKQPCRRTTPKRPRHDFRGSAPLHSGRKHDRPPCVRISPHVVSAPMVGTFYRSPSPGAPPFVEVGSKVKKGDPICIIEVMKLFTTIHAEWSGTVKEIGAENASSWNTARCYSSSHRMNASVKPRRTREKSAYKCTIIDRFAAAWAAGRPVNRLRPSNAAKITKRRAVKTGRKLMMARDFVSLPGRLAAIGTAARYECARAGANPIVPMLLCPFGCGNTEGYSVLGNLIARGNEPITLAPQETPGYMYNIRAMGEERRWKNTVFGTEDTIVLLAPAGRPGGIQGIPAGTGKGAVQAAVWRSVLGTRQILCLARSEHQNASRSER